MANNILIEVCRNNDIAYVVDLMLNVFAKYEQTSKALNLPSDLYKIYAEYITKKAALKNQILIAKSKLNYTGYLIWEDYHKPLVLGLKPNSDISKLIAPEILFVEILEENLDKIIDTASNRIARLIQAAVVPAYQNKGIASLLIENSITQITKKKYHYIIADCTADNSWSILKKFGFEIIREIPYKEFKIEGVNPFVKLNGSRRLIYKKINC